MTGFGVIRPEWAGLRLAGWMGEIDRIRMWFGVDWMGSSLILAGSLRWGTVLVLWFCVEVFGLGDWCVYGEQLDISALPNS